MATPHRREPWDRQPKESPQAFAAFTTYRDLGIDRSHSEVARMLGKSQQLMSRWSRSHSWGIRVQAWDQEEDRRHRNSLIRQRIDASKRHATIAKSLQGKIVNRLQKLDPDELSTRDLIRWLDVAVKVERQALGVSDKVELTGAGGGPVQTADVTLLTDEERLTRLAMLQREIGARLAEQQEELDTGDDGDGYDPFALDDDEDGTTGEGDDAP